MPRLGSAAKVGSCAVSRSRSPFSMQLAKMPCQDVHGLPVLDKGPEQVAGQRLGLGHGQLHSQNAGQDVLNELFLQLVGQRVDILIVGVKGGFVYARQRTEILDLDLCPQLQKGLFDGTVGFFDADVQK